jgi:hypothetical protein
MEYLLLPMLGVVIVVVAIVARLLSLLLLLLLTWKNGYGSMSPLVNAVHTLLMEAACNDSI